MPEAFLRLPPLNALRAFEASARHLNFRLAAHGADVNLADKTGRNSALIEAIKGRHYEVAEYLLESRKVNFLNKDMNLGYANVRDHKST